MTGRLPRRLCCAIAIAALAACSGGGTADVMPTPAPTPSAPPGSAFFYQNVEPAGNNVRAGFTTDGRVVETYANSTVLLWQVLGGQVRIYGDPVFSRLSNGRWVMTAGTGFDDPRGSAVLMYHESACPAVTDAAVRVIGRSRATGCEPNGGLLTGKGSQVFELDGARFIVTTMDGKVHLIKLADATHATADLASICVRRTAPASAASLPWGEAAPVLDQTALLLSDTAIARRRDGTWVLFVKGIAPGNGCAAASLCELCARGIYRATSRDLVTWSALERVAFQASVPEASAAADGAVWLYHQNFAAACAAQNIDLAARAPITGMAESATGAMGTPVNVTLPREPADADTRLHFPTNGNPVLLPDAAAKASLEACFAR